MDSVVVSITHTQQYTAYMHTLFVGHFLCVRLCLVATDNDFSQLVHLTVTLLTPRGITCILLATD